MAKKILNVRITPEEEAILSTYTEQTGRTKTDVIREAIRSLKTKKKGPKGGEK